jgi:voltage-gated potassium channel
MLRRRLWFSLAGIAAVIVGGTVGYRLIEGWSWLDAVWMLMITLTTIGYSERTPLSDVGRLYTIGLVVLGLSLATFSLSTLTQFVVGGGLSEQLRRRRKERVMKHMQDHFIVVGCGRLGREVAADLAHRGHAVVVVDTAPPDPTMVHVQIQGDATADSVLQEARLGEAQGLAICTGSDATNVFVTLSARQLRPDLNIVTRVDEETAVQKALRAGASAVLNPYAIGGSRVAQGLVHPMAATLVDRTMSRAFEEFEMEDVVVGESEYTGTVRELQVSHRHNVLVVAIRKPDGTFQRGHEPGASIQPGDTAVVVGAPGDIRGFAHAVRGRSVR